VRHAGGGTAFDDPERDQDGGMRVGRWRIQAELDAAKPASMLIERADGQAALAVDKASVVVGSNRYDLPESTSILVEADQKIVKRCGDELPAAAR